MLALLKVSSKHCAFTNSHFSFGTSANTRMLLLDLYYMVIKAFRDLAFYRCGKVDEEDEEKEGSDREDVEEPEPRTRNELYERYGKKGPISMANTFAQDDMLQYIAIILTELTGPVEVEYANDLQAMGKGSVAQGQWSADRAQGKRSWVQTISRIISIMQGRELYRRMRFTLPFGEVQESYQDSGIHAAEANLLKTIWAFGMQLISQYTDTHVMYWGLPHSFAGFLLSDPEEREVEISKMIQEVHAVLDAHQLVSDGKANKDLVECFKDFSCQKNLDWFLPKSMSKR